MLRALERRLMARDGLLAAITKSALERALDIEIADQLGYGADDPAAPGRTIPATATAARPALTIAGPVELEVPSELNDSLDPNP